MAKRKVGVVKKGETVERVRLSSEDLSWEKGSVEDHTFPVRGNRNSPYSSLVDAVMALDDGECVSIPVNGKKTPDAFRLGVFNAIRTRRKALEDANDNSLDGYKIRVRLNRDHDAVVVSMHHVEEGE